MSDTTTTVNVEPRSVDGNRGTGWWTDGWKLFTASAGMWIVLTLILLLIFTVLAFVPVLGSVATSLLTPVFIGGWMLAARKVKSGGALEPADLFAGFKDKLTPLIVLGALLLVSLVVIFLIMGLLGFGAAMGMMAGGGPHGAGGMMAVAGAGMLALLIGIVLGFVVAIAFWFAPALVVLAGVAPVDALKLSVSATLRNVVPFLIYGVLYIAAAIVASIPFGIGWIVLVPVMLLTIYVSYEDVFG